MDNYDKQVWDYQTKSCVQTLEGHTHNISAVCFHPELPIIITGSEDGTVRIWHSTTYRLLSFLCQHVSANCGSIFPSSHVGHITSYPREKSVTEPTLYSSF